MLAIDAVGAKHSGAATVLRAVVGAALKEPGAEMVVAFCSPRGMRGFEFPPDRRLEIVDVPDGEAGPVGRVRWLTGGLPKALREKNASVALMMSGAGTGPTSTRSVLFIQQSLPFCREALSRLGLPDRLRMAAIRSLMKRSAMRAEAVIVQTDTMRGWVVRGLKVGAERVHVVPPCATLAGEAELEHPCLESMQRTTEGRRFLYVGNESSYKNLEVLGSALSVARRSLPGARLFATVAPGHALSRVEGVIPLGPLEPGVLSAAYQLATALIMPSLVETVGLPMLEAMALGTAVIAADRPYAREVCGDAALFFDPCNPSELAEKLVQVASDGRLRSGMEARGRKIEKSRADTDPYRRLIRIVLNKPLVETEME